ncbi:MAG: chorismate pyruvate-lyase family protein [Hydrococcus sp. Prado102]|jgi:chorismate-pyruvate lyase|nr:chorismate pyruvate-lyase family protein [Hydrococcus sp. Prado102]
MNVQNKSLSTVANTKNETKLPSSLLRNDLQESLTRNHIDPSVLSTFQRILLTTDGTVTDILEAYLFEQIRVVKLSEQLVSLTHEIPSMDLKEGTEVIVRKILLQGKISRKNVVYAESIVVPEKLEEKFRKALLETKVPIGKIWFEQRVETFKEILDSKKEFAGDLADYFNIEPSDEMLSRTYRVVTNRKSVMMITEKFPESYFLKSL